MFAYPTSFPTEEAKVLVSAMSGSTSAPPPGDTMHAAWVMGGYAMSQMAPVSPAVKKGKVTVGEMKVKLEEAIKQADSKQGIHLPTINLPWCELYCLLFRTIQEGVQILLDATCYC